MNTSTDYRPFFSITEVAQLLGVHRSTVSRLVSQGELKASRIGHRTVRVARQDLMDFLKEREVPPPSKKEGSSGEAG